MPRGYTSFRILDIWGNKMFISDDQTKLNLCELYSNKRQIIEEVVVNYDE